MRKISFKRAHDYFEGVLGWWRKLLTDVVGTTRIVSGERHEFLDTSVLRISAMWEMLVQEDLVCCLNRDSSAYAKTVGLTLPKHLSRDMCEAVLFGSRYLDFRSTNDLRTFAKRHLTTKYNVFAHIPTAAAQQIDDFLVIRNLVSHYSSFAQRSYDRMLVARYDFKRGRAPAEFLIARDSKPGRERRVFRFLSAFESASKSMRNAAEKA